MNSVEYYLPDVSVTTRLAAFFSIFADSTRLRLLSALALCNMRVTDVAAALNMNQTTVSHQLKLLRAVGAVSYRRQGKELYYSLADNRINEVLLLGVEYLGY